MSLKNRTAVITGGAGNLGQTLAETLAELGANLVLVDLSGSSIEDLAANLSARFDVTVSSEICDLECEEQRKGLAERVTLGGDVDILINNAAFVGTSDLSGWSETFEKQSLESWRRALEVNLTAAFHLSQLFSPSLTNSVGGSIINIGSIYGELAPDWSLYEGLNMHNPAAYGASKAGLLQFTRWLSTALAPKVRVNAISPGGIQRGQHPDFIKRYSSKTPLGRMAEEGDLRGPIAFLASDMSAYMTGQVLNVDGGWGVW
jgi:NAD(P)-dependent dehydrogenase (short-subunit alcohol dehydrogenase family)